MEGTHNVYAVSCIVYTMHFMIIFHIQSLRTDLDLRGVLHIVVATMEAKIILCIGDFCSSIVNVGTRKSYWVLKAFNSIIIRYVVWVDSTPKNKIVGYSLSKTYWRVPFLYGGSS